MSLQEGRRSAIRHSRGDPDAQGTVLPVIHDRNLSVTTARDAPTRWGWCCLWSTTGICQSPQPRLPPTPLGTTDHLVTRAEGSDA